MDLNALATQKDRKCFKCEKLSYICRFCRNKAMEVANVLDLKNEGLLALKGSQKEEL